jgi:Mce-associated membrane protein
VSTLALDEPRAVPIRFRWRWVATVLVAAVVIALGALALAQWQRASDLAGDAADRRDVAGAAGGFAAALLTYDHDDLDASRAQVASLATPSFAEEYATAFDEGLSGVIGELDAVATATVRDVFVGDVDDGRATAVAVVDATVRSAAGTRELTGSYLHLELERVDGRWLVSAASAVGAEGETVAG